MSSTRTAKLPAALGESTSEVMVDDSTSHTTKKLKAVEDDSSGSTPSVEVSIHQQTRNNIKKNRWASHVARNPWCHFGSFLVVSLIVSGVGLSQAEFEIGELKGWLSRGTDMAKKQQQVYLVQQNIAGKLRYDSGWDELIADVQPSWEAGFDDSLLEDVRRLEEETEPFDPFQCDLSWYEEGRFVNAITLWPVWRVAEGHSALDKDVLRDICQAEQVTQNLLESKQLCGGCPDGCLPPLSLVSFARIYANDLSLSLSCDELATSWERVRPGIEPLIKACVDALQSNYTQSDGLPSVCPLGFAPHMVDTDFVKEGSIRTTSSVFSTGNAKGVTDEDLYDALDGYGRAESSALVEGVYDTNFEHLSAIAFARALISDTVLAIAAGTVTTLAMLIHTKSLWLTFAGLIQIFVSFPLAYFVYRIALGIEFFPFLNFLGIYVVLALGADDVFVAVDKWKNARIAYPLATREEIASVALPDAATSMFLTTITTAIAFWATTICPVTALRVFAIFLGLIIIFDYLLCVVLVFPAICLFDKWKEQGTASCFVEFGQRRRQAPVPPPDPPVAMRHEYSHEILVDEDGGSTSLHLKPEPVPQARLSVINRILTQYYKLLHCTRYFLLPFFFVGFVVSIYYALQLRLPATSSVRQLPMDRETELNFSWRQELLDESLLEQIGRQVQILWGVNPADTGNHLVPDEGTNLVLDDSFDPTPADNQLYLQSFCHSLLQQEFANPATDDFECPLDIFETWLSSRSNVTVESSAACPNSTRFPVSPEYFDACIREFLNADHEDGSIRNRILLRDGKTRLLRLEYQQIGIRFDSGYSVLDAAWTLFDGFMHSQNAAAPEGVENAFGSSFDFWWYETNGKMLFTAVGGTAIALGAAFVVLLLSTRSLQITLFAVLTIADILFTVSMLLTLSGWTLGFIEAICFAILVGMSCDFVLHFSHSYCSLAGNVDRHTRTKHALIKMGPSILAAGITTISAAIVMMFAQVNFFLRFALILLYSLGVGLVASFVVFFALTDAFGPSEPTKFIDGFFGMCCCKHTDGDTSQDSAQQSVLAETPRDTTVEAKPIREDPMVKHFDRLALEEVV